MTAQTPRPHGPRVCVAVLVTDPDGRILLGRRAKDPNRGEWTLPGGGIEAGEIWAEAAAREVREEAGLDVQIPLRQLPLVVENTGSKGTAPGFAGAVILCVRGTAQGAPRGADGFLEPAWFAPEALPEDLSAITAEALELFSDVALARAARDEHLRRERISDAARALFTGAILPADVAAFAARFPCRPIPPTGSTYLSRYTLADLAGGGHLFLHFFHRSDADPELHSHPWSGTSLILTGGYREERRVGSPGDYRVEERIYGPGSVNVLHPDTFHRVELLDPAAGCWTLFLTGKRCASWGFWEQKTGTFTPYADFYARRGAEESDR